MGGGMEDMAKLDSEVASIRDARTIRELRARVSELETTNSNLKGVVQDAANQRRIAGEAFKVFGGIVGEAVTLNDKSIVGTVKALRSLVDDYHKTKQEAHLTKSALKKATHNTPTSQRAKLLADAIEGLL